MSNVVASGKVVLFRYTLTNDQGETLDSSDGGDPMPYLHGAGNIVPGLERQMTGKAVGARFQADVPPAEGYGVRDPDGAKVFERNLFPPGAHLAAGMQFMVQDQDGQHMPMWIISVGEDQVHVDFNHPLAGQALHFAVEIVSMRDATAEEIHHGHPHGPDGHGGHSHSH